MWRRLRRLAAQQWRLAARRAVRRRGPTGRAFGAAAIGSQPSSGNHAFDEYRTETLRRLEDEQKEFSAFLERLRFARGDKAEFDQFMNERRSRPPARPEPPQTSAGEG